MQNKVREKKRREQKGETDFERPYICAIHHISILTDRAYTVCSWGLAAPVLDRHRRGLGSRVRDRVSV